MNRVNARTAHEQVALDFLHAWTSGDETGALVLCHEDLVFQGPIERREGGATQVAALIGVGRGVRHVEVKKVISSGADVVVLYDLTMATPNLVVSIAEENVVVDGVIQSLRAYFDTYPLRGVES